MFSTILRINGQHEWRTQTRREHSLLNVPDKERQVENKSNPVAVDEEQDGQERVYSGLGDDVGVETVAEVDRVDVVTVR